MIGSVAAAAWASCVCLRPPCSGRRAGRRASPAITCAWAVRRCAAAGRSISARHAASSRWAWPPYLVLSAARRASRPVAWPPRGRAVLQPQILLFVANWRPPHGFGDGGTRFAQQFLDMILLQLRVMKATEQAIGTSYNSPPGTAGTPGSGRVRPEVLFRCSRWVGSRRQVGVIDAVDPILQARARRRWRPDWP